MPGMDTPSRRVASVISVLALVAAGCTATSPTDTALDEDDDVGPTTTYVYLDPTTTVSFQPTTTTTGSTCGAAELVFQDWSIDGDATQAVEVWPFLGYQSEFLTVHATAEDGARFYLRAVEGFDTGGSADLESAVKLFTRGQPIPPEAVFSGYSTEFVEIWWNPGDLDAVFMVPRTNSGFIETEKWPAIPFGGHCQ